LCHTENQGQIKKGGQGINAFTGIQEFPRLEGAETEDKKVGK